ncbi:MAG: hypothetical protein OHK0029_00050 [Armatimonadaceae bacterium]
MNIFRRDRRTASVSNLVTEQLTRLGIEKRVRQHLALRVWAEVVGPQVAAATEPDRVQDGVLFIATKSAVWAHELTFYKTDILRRLNYKLQERPGSEPIITDLRFLNRGTRKQPAAPIRPALAPRREELEDVDLSRREMEAIDQSIATIAAPDLKERVRAARIAAARLQTWRLDNGWGPCARCGELCPPKTDQPGEIDCARCRIQRNQGR